jgi:hypothetical protein
MSVDQKPEHAMRSRIFWQAAKNLRSPTITLTHRPNRIFDTLIIRNKRAMAEARAPSEIPANEPQVQNDMIFAEPCADEEKHDDPVVKLIFNHGKPFQAWHDVVDYCNYHPHPRERMPKRKQNPRINLPNSLRIHRENNRQRL